MKPAHSGDVSEGFVDGVFFNGWSVAADDFEYTFRVNAVAFVVAGKYDEVGAYFARFP